MIRIYARWGLLRDPAPYAYRIVTNLARDHWTGREREIATWTHVSGGAAVAPPDVGVIDAVRRLPRRLRDVVLLHYWADLPLDAVAAAVHRPLGTVKRRLFEARAALALALEETP